MNKLSQVVKEISAIIKVVCEMKNEPSTFDETVKEILSVVENPIVAGGLAVSYYDKIRATTDMDFVGMANLGPYTIELQNLGFKKESVRLNGLTMEMFTKGKHGVDFMAFDNAAFEKSVISRSKLSTLFGHKVRIVSLEDLIVMKKIAGRKKDIADLEGLEKLGYDSKYVEKWMDQLK